MDVLLEWVRNLAVCMILIAAVVRILPKNHFEKYIRFYTGLLVLILVIRPLLHLFSLDSSLLRSFQYYMDQMGDRALEEQMKEAEEKREASITGQMEGQAAKQITGQVNALVSQEGMEVADCNVIFDWDETSERYGQIQSVAVTLEDKREEGTVEAPVVILGSRIEVGEGKEEDGEAKDRDFGAQTKAEEAKRRSRLLETVRQAVADWGDVDSDRVSVSVAE